MERLFVCGKGRVLREVGGQMSVRGDIVLICSQLLWEHRCSPLAVIAGVELVGAQRYGIGRQALAGGWALGDKVECREACRGAFQQGHFVFSSFYWETKGN